MWAPQYLRSLCDYVHLNPARAKMIAPDKPLEAGGGAVTRSICACDGIVRPGCRPIGARGRGKGTRDAICSVCHPYRRARPDSGRSTPAGRVFRCTGGGSPIARAGKNRRRKSISSCTSRKRKTITRPTIFCSRSCRSSWRKSFRWKICSRFCSAQVRPICCSSRSISLANAAVTPAPRRVAPL